MTYLVPSSVCVAYGVIFFCTSLLHNIFLVYHVQAFVSGFGLSKSSFWSAELVFLVWNAINDPLFGWLLDKNLLQEPSASSGTSQLTARRRSRMISIVGPILAITFLMIWFSCWLPGYPGCRLAIVLCLYDTATTLLDLQKGALLADLAVTQVDRSLLGSAASIGQMLSASGLVFITWLMGSLEDIDELSNKSRHEISHKFRFIASLLALVSAFGLWSAGRWLANLPNLTSGLHSAGSNRWSVFLMTFSLNLKFCRILVHFAMQFSLLSLNCLFHRFSPLKVFHCHFNSNFFPLFAKSLLGPDTETLFCAILGTFSCLNATSEFDSPLVTIRFFLNLLGLSFVLPHISNVFLLKASETVGTYAVIRCLFMVKVVLGITLYLSGRGNWFILSIFLACNRIFTEGVCKLLSQIISDLVDEDFVLNDRVQPLSALMFGATSLLGRPGQTFAPLVGYSMLSALTGKELISESGSLVISASDNEAMGTEPRLPVAAGDELQFSSSTLPEASFILACSVPLLVGCLQLGIWSYYKLHGSNLLHIKTERLKRCGKKPSGDDKVVPKMPFSV
ncbi:unnamed protein product [Schistocephalus solidus]|uniref:Transmembrane protein 180 n=2 Tax=Schistocephalus solidus TaxID=70667 RepID=A0A183SPZ5_SCHSO|nr:unnamed protein product [Schistocephalus solidus]